mmetsp:Transcript_76200/g.210265  ORF Transcript_76200/g.210265 Transcript_76200/m.210265 type:complete len:364 (+) Transcript_76200:1111-2202(+)
MLPEFLQLAGGNGTTGSARSPSTLGWQGIAILIPTSRFRRWWDLLASAGDILLAQHDRRMAGVVACIECLLCEGKDALAEAAVHQRTCPRHGLRLDDPGEALPAMCQEPALQGEAVLDNHELQDLRYLSTRVVWEVKGVRNPSIQAIVLVHEVLHVRRVACEDHNGSLAGGLVHGTHQLLDCLLAELVPPLRQSVGLVDEEDTPSSLVNDLLCFWGCLTHEARDKLLLLHLREGIPGCNAHPVEQPCHEPGQGSLPCARIPLEDHVVLPASAADIVALLPPRLVEHHAAVEAADLPLQVLKAHYLTQLELQPLVHITEEVSELIPADGARIVNVDLGPLGEHLWKVLRNQLLLADDVVQVDGA